MSQFAYLTQKVLDDISRHCPDAMSTYLICVNKSDKEGDVFFTRENIEVDMSESWTLFKNSLKKLAREGLLEWHPVKNGIVITLADLNDHDD